MGSIWEISWIDLSIRMGLAAILGGLIGFEREWSNHAAGFRTHILVCLGSTTIMMMSIYGFSEFVDEANVRIDPARLAAQVISGIGFLGAGAILRNGNMIKGLTTAASIWTVAAIGLCVGAGFYAGALLCTLIVLISLYVLNKWEKLLLRHRRYQTIEVRVADRSGLWGRIAAVFETYGIQVSGITIAGSAEGNGIGRSGQDHPTGNQESSGVERPGSRIAVQESASAQERPTSGMLSNLLRSGDDVNNGEYAATTLIFKLKSQRASDFLIATEALMKMEGVLSIVSESLAEIDRKTAKEARKAAKVARKRQKAEQKKNR